MFSKVESKVIAAAAGSGFGGAFGGFVLWLLGVTAWGTPNDARHATDAVAAVPEPVGGLLVVVLAVLGAYLAGYAAPHTTRPDLTPAPEAATPASPAVQAESATPAEPAVVDPAAGAGVDPAHPLAQP